MKRKLSYLLSLMLIISLASYGIIKLKGSNKQYEEEGLTVVTSFYPMYIAALNIADGIEGVNVINLTENQTGCVHDYQLTTKDMRTLSGAEVVILNGAEMEEFLEEIIAQHEELKVIDSSQGMEFLTGTSHNHFGESHIEGEESETEHSEEDSHIHEEEHVEEYLDDHSQENLEEHLDDHSQEDLEEHVHNHSNINGHVWLNLERYKQQIQAITEGLCRYDEQHATMYQKNASRYLEKVEKLKLEMDELKALSKGVEVIIFHDSFAYLAEELGMEVVHAVDTDGETALSAGEIAEVIEEIKLHDIKYLFTEAQFEHTIADRIEAETGATVYVLDSLVTGIKDKDSYLKGMKQNIDILKKAMQSPS